MTNRFTVIITSDIHSPRIFHAHDLEFARTIAKPSLGETNFIFDNEKSHQPIETLIARKG